MVSLAEQYAYNTAKGPYHEPASAIPPQAPSHHPVRFIAYYLPQYHPIPVNDHAWGSGFTEWTNATKALPRYVGHYQPRLPADLGFYDLRSADTIARQADLARRGGIYGFCLHNYWFGGKRLLETPLELILANPDIDIPFCLNWANENWSRRWDGGDNEILVAQHYSPADDVAYAESLIPAVEDPRYIRIDGRPLVLLYRPGILPDARATVERWREVFVRHGIANPYIVTTEAFQGGDPRPEGFDATAGFPPHKFFQGTAATRIRKLDPQFYGIAKSYEQVAKAAINSMPKDYMYFPGVMPAWDNEARKPQRGTSFYGSTPALYGRWLRAAAEYVMKQPSTDERIVFINAWNEWAEGTYLEPDRHFGHAYLAETARVLGSLGMGSQPEGGESNPRAPARFRTTESFGNYLANRMQSAMARLVRTLLSER